MSPITVTDETLKSFFTDNPHFEILTFNLTNQQNLKGLNWNNFDLNEKENIIELLKKYQRLLRIDSNPETAEKLIKLGIDSAQAIAAMSEEQFKKLLPGEEKLAEQMYQKAKEITAKTHILWANLKDAFASPYYSSMRSSNVNKEDVKAIAQQIPSYQEIFKESLDYLKCDHDQSIFGAAAYFVDLMRIVDDYITKPNQETIKQANGKTLLERRPDLEKIQLTGDNTNQLVPTLEIINHILEKRIEESQEIKNTLQFLATSESTFNLPLEQIRSYLKELKTDLATIYETFGVNELAVAKEYIGLSQEEYNLIIKPEGAEVNQVLNIKDLTSETIENLLPNEQKLDYSALKELTTETLESEAILRFIRLAEKLDWSFSDLAWVLNSIQAEEISDQAIINIAKIKKIQTQYQLPLDVFCGFWYEMKTHSLEGDAKEKTDLFNRVYNNPFAQFFTPETFIAFPDDNKTINLETLKQQTNLESNNDKIQPEDSLIVARLLAALRLTLDELINIVKGIWKEDSVKLTVENLSILFRISRILQLLDLTFEDYQKILKFLDIKNIKLLTIDNFIKISDLAEWIKKSNLTIDELDYIVNGEISKNLPLKYTKEDIPEGMKSFWDLASNLLITPSTFVSQTINQETSLAIFDYLSQKKIMIIKDVTKYYKKELDRKNEERIGILLVDQLNDEQNKGLEEVVNNQEEKLKEVQEKIKQTYYKQREQLKEIGSFFGVKSDLAASFVEITSKTKLPNNYNQNYLEILLTPVSIPTQTATTEEEQAQWKLIITILKFISRIKLLTDKLVLTPTQLKCIANYKDAFGINDLFKLKIQDIQTIENFKKLVGTFQQRQDEAVLYLSSLYNQDDQTFLDELEKLTGWDKEQIKLLITSKNNPEEPSLNFAENSYKTVEGIIKLKNCFDLCNNLGVNISWVINLLKLSQLSVIKEEDWNYYQNTAQIVKSLVKAKYEQEEWVKISEKIEGKLNEQERNILTQWIIVKNGYKNLRHLYLSQELLIDVETSSANSVSYIKEATLAIQTYLHRCRMGLEPGIHQVNIPENWWKWIMNYRVWEANRKVFLYPENYLDPNLRETQTPIYKELQEELLQSEITPETVEKAYQNYFEKFAELAHLKIAATYYCNVNKLGSKEGENTLFIFGRTATEPSTYYYRKCIISQASKSENSSSNRTLRWQPWQKIDLTINADYINATYAFNKLFIFWVEITKIDKTQEIQIKGEKAKSEIKPETKAIIKYSFQKFGEQWVQPQTLAKDIVIENYDHVNPDNNLWRKVSAFSLPAKGSEPEKIITLFGELSSEIKLGREEEETKITFKTKNPSQGISLSSDLLTDNHNIILSSQSFTGLRSAISESKLTIIKTPNPLYNNYADDWTDVNVKNRLVAYWPMNEGTGDKIVDYVDNIEGKCKNNLQWKEISDFPGTESRYVVEFKNNEYIECPKNKYNAPMGDKYYTISAWIKPSKMGKFGIIGWGKQEDRGDSSKNKVNALGLDESGINYSWCENRVDPDTKVSLAKDVNGRFTWNHVVATCDGKERKIFLNGNKVLCDKKTSGHNVPEDYPLTIGKTWTNDYFNGQIAEISIWNVGLSDQEIKQIHQSYTSGNSLITQNLSKSHSSVRMVKNQPGWFTFDNGDESFLAIPEAPHALQSIDKGLTVKNQKDSITLSYKDSDNELDISNLNYTFYRLTTNTIQHLSQKMFMGGLDCLLTPDSQLTSELNFSRFSPSGQIIPPNTDKLDFEGPLGLYYKEIFFHIPFLVANSLQTNKRFEEAQKWYHYIFNPTVQSGQFNPTIQSLQFETRKCSPIHYQKDLVAHWIMNESQGKIIPDPIGNNDGTLKGNAKLQTVNGRNVLQLYGDESYLECNKPFKTTNALTVALWAKSSTEVWKNCGGLVSQFGGGLHTEKDSKDIRFYIFDEGYETKAKTKELNINITEWHHYVGVFDGNNKKIHLYVDGSKKVTVPVKKSEISSHPDRLHIDIGREHFVNPCREEYFNGQIAEVCLWKAALSDEQIFEEATGNIRERFWCYLPFRGQPLQKLEAILKNDGAIQAYNDHPFDPHAIASLRIGAYQKAIVMKYINNLLDWGDPFVTT